jgi:hypothetical protein
MKDDGKIIFATEKAKQKYEGKIIKSTNKFYCPSCELKLNTTFIKEPIKESILNKNN